MIHNDFNLITFFQFFRNKWLSLFAPALVGIAASWVYSSNITPVYRSSVILEPPRVDKMVSLMELSSIESKIDSSQDAVFANFISNFKSKLVLDDFNRTFPEYKSKIMLKQNRVRIVGILDTSATIDASEALKKYLDFVNKVTVREYAHSNEEMKKILERRITLKHETNLEQHPDTLKKNWKSKFYRSIYNDSVEDPIEKLERLNNLIFDPEKILTFSLNHVPSLSSKPYSPNLLMNLTIGGVLFFLISLFIHLVVNYIKCENNRLSGESFPDEQTVGK